MSVNIHVFHYFVNFLVLQTWIYAFEVAKEVQMFLNRHEIKQYVVLWTNAHDLPQVCYIFLDLVLWQISVDELSTQTLYESITCVNHTSEH